MDSTLATPLATRVATVDDVPVIARHRRLMFESMGYTDPARNDEAEASARRYLLQALPGGDYRGWLTPPERARITTMDI